MRMITDRDKLLASDVECGVYNFDFRLLQLLGIDTSNKKN